MAKRCTVKKSEELIRLGEIGAYEFVCEICGKGFPNSRSLETHKQIHDSTRKYVCLIEGCSSSFKYKQSLVRHKRSVHEGVKFECPVCGRMFGQSFDMKIHVETVHKQIKKFKCHLCGMEFGQAVKLKTHIDVVHNKIKAFSCHLCNKSFADAGYRKVHIEEVHLKNHVKCTWDGCSWTGPKRYVKIHVRRAHTWEWSIECDICDRKGIWWGCIYPFEFKKHKKQCHPQEFAEEEKNYALEHPHVCKFTKCQKRFKTEKECLRHLRKLH